MESIEKELDPISLNQIVCVYYQFPLHQTQFFEKKQDKVLVHIVLANDVIVIDFFKLGDNSLVLVQLDNKGLLFAHVDLFDLIVVLSLRIVLQRVI
jgi:hypothetical protein